VLSEAGGGGEYEGGGEVDSGGVWAQCALRASRGESCVPPSLSGAASSGAPDGDCEGRDIRGVCSDGRGVLGVCDGRRAGGLGGEPGTRGDLSASSSRLRISLLRSTFRLLSRDSTPLLPCKSAEGSASASGGPWASSPGPFLSAAASNAGAAAGATQPAWPGAQSAATPPAVISATPDVRLVGPTARGGSATHGRALGHAAP